MSATNAMRFLAPILRLRDGFSGRHDFSAETLEKIVVLTPDFQMSGTAVHKLFQCNQPRQDLLLLSFGKRRIADRFKSRHVNSPCSGWLSYTVNNHRTNHIFNQRRSK
nr:MAG TPA: hypothetical protein [Caudoviricetes sp.]